jgi:Glycosyl transferase family 2
VERSSPRIVENLVTRDLRKRNRHPTLSVFIPYFRGAHVICRAVESALTQTLTPNEIVICDDGSPDDLEAALGPLLPRVRIVRKQNGGVGSAMRAATEAARGEFVVPLDQDDVFEPERLEAIMEVALARPDVDVIATDAVIEHDGRPITTFAKSVPFRAEGQRMAILSTCFFTWPAIRRARLFAVGGYDATFKCIADWDCHIRLILDGAVVTYIDEPLYRWHLTPGSLLSDGTALNLELVRALNKALASGRLDSAEQAVAEANVAARYRDIQRLEARSAIEYGRSGARRRSLHLVLERGFSPPTRAKAAIAVISPSLTRRFLAWRADRDPAAEALASRLMRRPR